MPHVSVEKNEYTLIVSVDDDPVLETGLDLIGNVVLDLSELLDLLEETSDQAVEYIDLEE